MKSEVYFYSGNLQETKVRPRGNVPGYRVTTEHWTIMIILLQWLLEWRAGCIFCMEYWQLRMTSDVSSDSNNSWTETRANYLGAGLHLAIRWTFMQLVRSGVRCVTSECEREMHWCWLCWELGHKIVPQKADCFEECKDKGAGCNDHRLFTTIFMTLKSTIAPLNTLLV